MLTCNASRHTRHSFDMPLTAFRCFIWFKFYECFVCFMSFSLVSCSACSNDTRARAGIRLHAIHSFCFFFITFQIYFRRAKLLIFPIFGHSHTHTHNTICLDYNTKYLCSELQLLSHYNTHTH